ncbi:thiamine phosphate synthase [Marilutibacter alkalisoli]|uniref:Thiamine-phosphate synthase n=1 Tax=Marilutibacter alkalisoli TaxID=2591633 RepID=A0A514BQ34_9GAMM|nr:thiamine phosphate synthase [Lysobacter alkalisoli]QDH69139.1 thiamine phosphate synthase [Lysobacter alkalisoli]
MSPSNQSHRGVYAITPDEADTARLIERVSVVLDAGITWLQYRNKSAAPALRRKQALRLLALCRGRGVPLIINDDWRLAADIDADGAHLGENDGDIMAAREAMGDVALIGASCYDSEERARRAVGLGASYVAFGAFFPSPTKPDARRASTGLLASAAELEVPRVAIGGITPDNARMLVDAGADLVAVISGIFDAHDPAAAVRAYRDCFAPVD